MEGEDVNKLIGHLNKNMPEEMELHETNFYGVCIKTLLLSAPSASLMQRIIKRVVGETLLPVMQLSRNMRSVEQDVTKKFGRGPRALILTGQDFRKSLFLAPSIKTYLQQHVNRLKNNWYVTRKGFVETYADMPDAPGANGSVTVTNGVRIRAHAHYNHIVSQFDNQPAYVFSYQITFDCVCPDNLHFGFHKCKLLRRTWVIEKTPDEIDGVDD